MLCEDTTNVVAQFHENPKNALHRELLGLYEGGYGKFDEVIGWGLSWPMHLLRQSTPEQDKLWAEYRASLRQKWGDVTSAVGGRYKKTSPKPQPPSP